MKIKIFYHFTFLCIILVNCAICSPKYERISACVSTDHNCKGCKFVEFICGDINKEDAILYYENDAILCNDYSYYKYKFGTINFKTCRFHQIDAKFFRIFESLHTFNISDVELEVLNPNVFQEANNLTHLIASNNRLKQIPSLLFVKTNKLSYVDFSNNTIEEIDPLAFAGASNIEFLDLSRNNLTEFHEQLKSLTNLVTLNLSHNAIKELHFLRIPNLITFDMSYNKLTDLTEDTFNQTIKLKDLNLSFNSIGNLKLQTLARMPNLERIDLRATNISSIRLGTFSHQHKLISLDLSENLLKDLDFRLFMPILHDLKTLRLGENQLSHLNGFRNTLFPQLQLLDITGNNFNCTYLHHFMENIDWKHLHLHIAPHSTMAEETNIRGVRCNDILYEPSDGEFTSEATNEHSNENNLLESILKENLSKLNPKSNDDIFTKIVLVLILVILTVFVALFLIVNRNRICDSFKSNSANERSITFNKEQETLLF